MQVLVAKILEHICWLEHASKVPKRYDERGKAAKAILFRCRVNSSGLVWWTDDAVAVYKAGLFSRQRLADPCSFLKVTLIITTTRGKVYKRKGL